MKFSKEAKVGIFALLCLAILYIGFNYLKGIDFLTKTNKYYVIYNDIAGLNISNLVNISGFTVGRVSNIAINQEFGNKITVEVDIYEDIILGKDAVALLRIDLFGSVSIILDVGDLSQPIAPGDTIAAKVDPTLNELLKKSALPVADILQITIQRINTLLEEFSNNTEALKNIAINLEGITHKTNMMLSENRNSINKTIEGMATVTQKLSMRLDELGVVMSKYGSLADTLKSINLNETLAQTNLLLKNLNKTVALLQTNTGTLGRLMNDDSLYINLNKTLIDLDELLIHMNENPKHFFAPLGKKRKKIEKDRKKQEQKDAVN
ncbi:MAG: MCE family protein [Bacteroidetes bacterium]|nr:MCE family protein [Bacteroidota bacterium]